MMETAKLAGFGFRRPECRLNTSIWDRVMAPHLDGWSKIQLRVTELMREIQPQQLYVL
jgi:hypothetical protein